MKGRLPAGSVDAIEFQKELQAVKDGIQIVTNSKDDMEFIPANFPKRFPHDLHVEQDMKVVPPHRSTTAQMSDPPPPRQLRVKSGYTGHVPHGRDYIGGNYRSHDNRGTAGKESVPVIHMDPTTGKYPVETKYKNYIYGAEASKLQYHDVFNAKPQGDHQHEYGAKTTAPVPMRVEKVLSGDARDMTDEDNLASTLDMDGEGQWVMAGYTGHVPKAREVYGTSYYGPPEGPSYHGPYYESDKYYAPGATNKESVCP